MKREGDMVNKKKRGFTLIEVVVVLAVVAILAAILTPSIVKSINDSKIARANNETQVIGAAMASFYKDLGRWPTKDGTTTTGNVLYVLYSAGNPMTGVTNWISTSGTWAAQKDTFDNHLARNTPRGATVPANQYPVTGKFKWNGPYMTEVTADPWGTHYSCNVISLWLNNWTNYAVYVLSAGPDMSVTTPIQQLITTTTPPTLRGDDIGYRMQ